MMLSQSLGTRVFSAGLIALALFAISCRDTTEPTGPSALAAKPGGSGNPTVTSVVPSSAERGVTRDITVNGSGYDQGSAVRLERQGTPAAGITTNSTTYVSSSKLIANITIAANADVGKYDVAVLTFGGRKGVGIELFAVTYKLDELGIIGGTWSRAHAINDRGEVVGESCTDDCLATAFYWSEATGQVDLGALPGYSRSAAYAINERGQIFGEVSCRAEDPGCGGVFQRARVRWDRVGTGWAITPVQGCSVVRPAGDQSGRFVINDNDHCIALSTTFPYTVLVQTLSGGSVINTESLPSVLPGGSNHAYAISDARMAAGTATGNGLRVPAVWYRLVTGGWVALRLDFPNTHSFATANDISEPDVAGRVRVTGYADGVLNRSNGTSGSAPVALRWTLQANAAGAWQVIAMEVLPTTTSGRSPGGWGVAVNNAGDAVGVDGHIMDGVPIKWPVGGGRQSLPGLGSGPKGRAVAINSQGWIVGAVWDNTNKCDRAAIWRQMP